MSKLSKALIDAGQLIDDLMIEPEMIDSIKIDADKPKITIKLHGHEIDSVSHRATQVYLPALYRDVVMFRDLPNWKYKMTIADGPVLIEAVGDDQ